MAHNTKSILVDVNGKPIPQYFDPLADEYKPLLGQHGAARSILYGPDGNPISDTNKLPVRAADLETLIGALNDSAVTNPAHAASVIAALKGLLSVVGKEATLGQILSALAPLATESTLSSLASAVAKETTLAQVLSALGALATETTLGGVKTAVDTLAGTVADGAQKVTLSGRLTEIRSAGVIAGGSTTPDRRESANFKDAIGALATVVHFDVKEPVWLHQLALIQHVSQENQRNVVHRLYIYDSNGNAIWLPVMNSNGAFNPQYLRMSSFINADFTVRITEAYPWKLLPPVEWGINTYTAGLVFTAVPLPCPHGFRFESYNPDPENAAFYRFQGMAYYTRM